VGFPRGTRPCLMTQSGSHSTYLHIAQNWFFLFFWATSIVASIKCDHLYQLGLQVVVHYQWQFSFLLCFHIIINNSSLFMSMSNFLLININIMDMKRHMLVCFFISMLVGKENRKILIKKKKKLFEKEWSCSSTVIPSCLFLSWQIKLICLALFTSFPSLWLMWVCLFNFISVGPKLHLVYFLSIPLSSSIVP
jgi:hypothetical protein